VKPWLWPTLERRLRRALPPARAASVAGDLLEDFDRRCRRDGRLRAEWWLRREVRSTAAAYRAGERRGPRHAARSRRSVATASPLDGLMFDFRLALRSLRRQPALTAVIVATVGSAVAANTALFSIFDGLLFRPLPYRDAERIVRIGTRQAFAEAQLASGAAGRNALIDSLETSPLLVERTRVLQGLLFEDGAQGVADLDLRPADVTPAFFELFDIEPTAGRVLSDEDLAMPVDPRRVMIGYDLWQARFGGDTGIVGRTINLPGAMFGRRFLVVGVMPRDVRFPDGAELWVVSDERPGSFNHARLAEGVTIDQVRGFWPGLEVRTLREATRPEGAYALGVLLASTGLLLLVAWVQVAALLFARAAGRARELGVRLAIGAGRRRLIRQFATEGALVAAGALGLAVMVAPAVTSAVVTLLPPEITRGHGLQPDGRTLLFAGALSLAGVLVLSLAPIEIVRRSSALGLMRAGGFSGVGQGAARLRFGLLAAQLAITATLLYMAGLSAGSFRAAGLVELGFAAEGVVGIQLPPTTVVGSTSVERRAHLDRQVQRWAETPVALRAVPGVEAAAGGRLPFHSSVYFGGGGLPLSVPGRDEPIPVDYAPITPDYVRVMGLRVTEGRAPGHDELGDGVQLALVNTSLARQLSAVGPVVGQRVTVNRRDVTIAGVVDDVVMARPDRPVAPLVMTLLQNPQGGYVLARLAPDAPLASTLDAIRAALDRVWPDNPSREVMLVSDLADRAIADYRARAVLLGLIGALCLPLALAGIAGALSYATSQRVREIGIRMALGAAPADIRRRVLGRAFTAVSLGLVVGLAGGMLMGRLMSSYLFGVRPIDGWTIVGAAAVLILTAWAASILPARRAARIEPAQALREGV
jgi:predicted permease